MNLIFDKHLYFRSCDEKSPGRDREPHQEVDGALLKRREKRDPDYLILDYA